MRRFICAVMAALMLCTAGARAESACEEALIRLHVIARDDSREAQRLKLEVRNAVLRAAPVLLADCTDADAAWRAVNAQLGAFGEIAAQAAGQPVRAEAGTYAFPDRVYGGVTVPAGRYRALRLVIGEGKGRNWWCVLYPSLCLASEDGYYSALAGWLQSWFGGDAA